MLVEHRLQFLSSLRRQVASQRRDGRTREVRGLALSLSNPSSAYAANETAFAAFSEKSPRISTPPWPLFNDCNWPAVGLTTRPV